jgi:group II intron reverse transcriptase/maturase
LEVDIRKFFDTLGHAQLREFLQLRVRDGVLLRLIGKWLHAGVMEEERIWYPESGSPQGGVISPLLANVYLHHVLDDWLHKEVLPRLKGHAFLIRYADDFVIAFTDEHDARRVHEVLPKRMSKYGLAIHPEKTRLVPFARPFQGRVEHGENPGTFVFLGFTHFWARSRKGNWVIKRQTASSRLTRAIRALAIWCRRNRHLPLAEQHEALCRKLRGHFQYYGVTGNSPALKRFRTAATRIWYKWLARRKRKPYPSWVWFARLLVRYPLPPAIPVHSVCLGAKA